MSDRKLAFVPLDQGETSRYFEYVEGLIESDNDKRVRKGQKLAERQVELWEEDDSCPNEDYDEYWTVLDAEVCLDMWNSLV
mgnify:CR=1 FL=1